MPGITQERLQNVFIFLDELNRASRKVYRDVQTDHKDFYVYGSTLTDLPEVLFDQVDSDGAPNWLEVPRLHPKKPPAPDTGIADWIRVPDDPEKPPTYHQTLTLRLDELSDEHQALLALVPEPEEEGDPVTLERAEHPDLEQALTRFHRKWEDWAEREAPRRKVIGIYGRLFQQAHVVEQSSESPMELVWGMGMTAWAPEGQTTIRYPMITQVVDVEIDDDHNICLRPRNRRPELETAPYREVGIPNLADFERNGVEFLEEHRDQINPLRPHTYAELLQVVARDFDKQGSYIPRDREHQSEAVEGVEATSQNLGYAPEVAVPTPGENLQIADDWVLFIRRRSTNVVSEDIRQLREKLEDAPEPGAIPRALVEEPPDEPMDFNPTSYRGLSTVGHPGEEADLTRAEDLFFPAPYNDEQVEIIQALDHFEGTVVKGPPGTGKTHTIANIICHYLATEKRVLVTSEREQALQVVKDFLPESVRPFAINLLTSDREGLKELEHAVNKLANEVSQENPGDIQKVIDDRHQRIDDKHRRIAQINHELKEIAQQHLGSVNFFGESFTPMELAERISQDRETHGWFPDAIAPETDSPLTDQEMMEVREARRVLGEDLVYFDIELPDPSVQPDPQQIRNLHEDLVQAAQLEDQQRRGDLPGLADNSQSTFLRANALLERIDAHRPTLRGLDASWKHALRAAYWAHQEGRPTNEPIEALEQLRQEMDTLREMRKKEATHPVTLPEDWVGHPDFHEVLAKAAAKGKLPWNPLRKKELQEALAGVEVEGEPPQGQEGWTRARDHAEFLRRCHRAITRWNQLAPEFGAPTVDTTGEAGARAITDFALIVTPIAQLATDFDATVPGELNALIPRGVDGHAAIEDPELLEYAAQILRTHLQGDALNQARRRVREYREALEGFNGPLVQAMYGFLRDWVGNSEFSAGAIEDQWGDYLSHLRRLVDQVETRKRLRAATLQLERAGAEHWAQVLTTEPVSGEHDPWIPGDWRDAWHWAQAATYLHRIDHRGRLRELTEERLSTEKSLADTYKEMVANRVLLAINKRLTPSVQASLNKYLHAVNKIGKGTGKWAPHWRKQAREAMMEANKAVPCWIMPHARVSESLPADPGLFDLVIVDEASQSTPYALPTLIRGQKALVVGDDKQVTPLTPGLDQDQVQYYVERYLKDLPNRWLLTPDTSLYNLAGVIFPKKPITLREHFRCVEPIIQFSNQLAYHNEIQPLRVPKPSERIDPPLVDMLVTDGYRKGKRKVNFPEAEVIVQEIENLLGDPAMGQRSIGVVSLLENDQANVIYNRLMERVGYDVLTEHNIRCGDASSFQGAEADIVFLSMVDDNDSAGRLAREDWRIRRFNVAASRARDRLYLVRSVHRQTLKAGDVRAELIDHFTNPPVHRRQGESDDPRSLCDSEFERNVYDELVRWGYRVRPQVPAGGFFIDLVVEDDDNHRLAIELDGDLYHPPEKWQEDTRRQRVLERIGWTFWRCWGSTYLMDRADCLQDLKEALDAQGVRPVGGNDAPINPYLSRFRKINSNDFLAGIEGEVEEVDGPQEVTPSGSESISDGEEADGNDQRLDTSELEDLRSDEGDSKTDEDLRGPGNSETEAFALRSEKVQAEIPFEEPAEQHPVSSEQRLVEVGDRVTFRFLDHPDSEPRSVWIRHGVSNQDTGAVHPETPWAQAMLEAEEGDDVSVNLPWVTHTIRIEKVEKPQGD